MRAGRTSSSSDPGSVGSGSIVAILGLTLEVWVLFVVAAAAGGAFGAAIGALPALSISGLLVVIGEATGDGLSAVLTGALPTGQQLPTLTGLGPVFGPQVAFAGGIAAAAYASRKGYMDTDFEYYEAKNIARPLGARPDVLTVGAAFGVFGVVVWRVVSAVGLPIDPIFTAVALSAIVHRLVLGFPLLGTPTDGGWLDMSAFRRENVATAAMGGEVLSGGGDRARHGDRLTVEPWLPHQYEWGSVVAIGLVGGVIGAYLALSTGSLFLAFGISAASLLFLSMGLLDVPVTHHVTLPASLAALAFIAGGAQSLPLALVVGTIFGLVSALVAEGTQRIFYAHADTHFDAAAVGILVTTLLVGLLIEAGLLGNVAWF